MLLWQQDMHGRGLRVGCSEVRFLQQGLLPSVSCAVPRSCGALQVCVGINVAPCQSN